MKFPTSIVNFIIDKVAKSLKSKNKNYNIREYLFSLRPLEVGSGNTIPVDAPSRIRYAKPNKIKYIISHIKVK